MTIPGRVREEYATWLALDKRTKVALRLPTTQGEFADRKGMSPRTLRRWKYEDDEFQQLVEQKAQEIRQAQKGGVLGKDEVKRLASGVANPRPYTDKRLADKRKPPEFAGPEDDPVVVEAIEEGLSREETEYRQVRDTITEMAKNGESKALDLYLKYWGQPFIEAEQDDQSEFPKLSDEEIVDRVLGLLGTETVATWLADQTSEAAA